MNLTNLNSVLLIGAGQLGSRHLQSLASIESIKNITVVEPWQQSADTAMERWNQVSPEGVDIKFYQSLEEVGSLEGFDACIVATVAKGRGKIIESLISAEVPLILAEKVLFQSIEEYSRVMSLLDKYDSKILVNHVYRYADIYQKIRSEKILSMDVKAGNNGFGCNLIHFLDLFEYISKDKISECSISLDSEKIASKRPGYSEFTGKARAYTKGNAELNVMFEAGEYVPPVVRITTDTGEIVIDEGTQEIEGAEINTFNSPMVSQLTALILKQALSDEYILPTIEESFSVNQLMLNSFNSELNDSFDDSTVCPIT